MANSKDYLDFVIDQLATWKTVNTIRMFGCAGLFVNGLMFGIISKNVVHFTVDETKKKQYIEADSEKLKLFKSNNAVASFYELPIEILEDPSQFVLWAEASLYIQKIKNHGKQIF